MFKKNIEDFVCGNCSKDVKGNGYTNHCPKCLWSKHVDIDPGDREADCKGMMKPMLVEFEKGEYILTNQCIKCGYKKRNKVSSEDDFDTLAQVAKVKSDSV